MPLACEICDTWCYTNCCCTYKRIVLCPHVWPHNKWAHVVSMASFPMVEALMMEPLDMDSAKYMLMYKHTFSWSDLSARRTQTSVTRSSEVHRSSFTYEERSWCATCEIVPRTTFTKDKCCPDFCCTIPYMWVTRTRLKRQPGRDNHWRSLIKWWNHTFRWYFLCTSGGLQATKWAGREPMLHRYKQNNIRLRRA